MSQVFNKIVEILRDSRFLDDNRTASREISINNDLFVQGDDAIDFLIKLQDTFHIDLSRFPFNDYFLSEGQFYIKKNYIELTIGDIENEVIKRMGTIHRS
jgi:hypothetical protein